MPLASLEIAKRALQAQRFGLDVTSNNIANANTAGYSRRSVTYSEGSPYSAQGNFNGTGVVVDKLRNFREEFFDREIREGLTRNSAYEVDDKIFNQIASIMGEPSDYGITEVVTDFFSAFSELSIKPESIGLRENLISKTQIMTDRIQSIASGLTSTRQEVYDDIYSTIDQINGLSRDIAGLNNAFASGKKLSVEDAQTVIDQRAKKLEELAEITGVKVTQNDTGSINVFMNGINLVTSHVPSELRISEETNASSGERVVKVTKVDAKGNFLNNVSPEGGKLESLLFHYNTTLDQEGGDGYSPAGMLHKFAETTVNTVNSISRQGFGLDDIVPTDPSGAPLSNVPDAERNFFEEVEGGANAFTMRINQEIVDSPRDMPLSDAAGQSGNSNIARQIGSLQDDVEFLESVTPIEYFSGMVGELSVKASQARNGLSTSKIINEQLDNQRESIIGVNLDEEAVNLIKFQQAFEASSRVVTTTNELLSTIINLGR
jgi:flagellar hook-associated protein 1 FlgK